MDCTAFEREIADLMACPDADPRGERREQLEAHAAACAQCADASELVAWIAMPRDARDDDDPGQLYWAGFQQRLRRRIAETSVADARKPARRWRPAAAAALALVAILSGWWLASWTTGPPGDGDPLAGLGPEELSAIEHRLGELFDPAVAIDLVGDEEAFDDEGWPFPDTAGLDAEERRSLLEWVRDQERALPGGSA